MNVVYDAETAKVLLFNMARDAGVKLLLHSFVTDVILEGNRVTGVVVANKSGKQVVKGDILIDASGDADVAAYAGAPFRKGQEDGALFAMTILVRLGRVDWSALSEYSKGDFGLDKAINRAKEKGDLPYYKPRTREMPNYWGHARPELSRLLYEDEALLWGGTVEGVDGTKVEDLTRAEVEARDQYMSELRFLKKYVPGFVNARIQSTGISIGVRDTRHIEGVQTLTGKDVLERRRFPDVAAYNVKGGFPANDIPYGCLVPRNIEGLLVCGNSISVIPGSTQRGSRMGSYNNLKDIPTMWTTGEAAGTAAALCVKTKRQPGVLEVSQLQAALKEQGALVSPERTIKLEAEKLPSGKTI